MPRPLDDVLAYLERALGTSSYDDRTSNGLLVHGTASVHRLGAALNTSLATIDTCVAANIDFLFVHHAPWASIELDLYATKLEGLKASNISLYAAHEALDRAATNSVGAVLARRVGLAIEREGGNDLVLASPPAMSFDAWTTLVADRLNTPVRAWPNAPTFQRIAVVPGGGGDTEYLARAAALGCDTFLTGEGSLYTELFAREHGLSLVLASHDATEFPAVCTLVASMASALSLEWHAIPEAEFITGGGRAPVEHRPRAI